MRTDMFQQSLEDLNGSTADIEACALISTDGLMIASALPQGMDEDRIGAMSAALLSLGERTARELSRGKLERVQPLSKQDRDWTLIFCLRLAVLLHRSREAKSPPEGSVKFSDRGFALAMDEDVLADSPLTAAALQEEADQWRQVGGELLINPR